MKNEQSNNSLVLLRGTISKFERSRRTHDFVLTEVQHQRIGATAIAAAAMGMGAAGMGLMGMAGNSDEEADWVEFELDGKQIQGWLWMMPMRNGDNVEVVAEHRGNGRYVAYAVKRDGDDLLAMYPHATAGRKVHYRKSVKAWLWCSLIIYLITTLMLVMKIGWEGLFEPNIQYYFLEIGPLLNLLVFGVIAFRVSRKMMGFVRIAELVFETFGWPDVKNIDLRKTSKENRRENKFSEFGVFYFRYK